MPKAFFVTGIELVPIVGAPVDCSVDRFLALTNDRTVVAQALSPAFKRKAGEMETDFLSKEATIIAYWLGDMDTNFVASPVELHQTLLVWLMRVRRFLLCLWLVKDNAASIEMGYAEAPHHQSPAIIWRNFWQGVISKADTSRDPTPFTGEELRRACELFVKTMGQLEREVEGGKPPISSRWNSALYFLDAARISDNPGVKIANYCTCLEALFGTDLQELSHKLAERVACFLESDPTERLNLFHQIKGAYKVRSKIVHGAKQATEAGLQARAASMHCDETLRRILTRILDDPAFVRRFIDAHDKDSDDFFNALVFGVDQGV